MLVEGPGLVFGGLEDGCAAHGCFGGGDEGEVFACDAEEDLPVTMLVLMEVLGVIVRT